MLDNRDHDDKVENETKEKNDNQNSKQKKEFMFGINFLFPSSPAKNILSLGQEIPDPWKKEKMTAVGFPYIRDEKEKKYSRIKISAGRERETIFRTHHRES